jgi:hypothetical protein
MKSKKFELLVVLGLFLCERSLSSVDYAGSNFVSFLTALLFSFVVVFCLGRGADTNEK